MAQAAERSLSGKLVAILGGSGFVGTHLAQELLSRGARLRVASRNPERAFRLKPLANLGQIQFARCNIARPDTVSPVLAGADAVVNLVGAFDGNLDAVQGKGLSRIASMARDAGVEQFVHISAIGADRESEADYARTKAQGETAVLDAFPGATIVRPSIVFGPDDDFTNMFAGLIATFPLLPVFGADARLQPVYVDDLAEGIGAILADPGEHGGKTFEFAGPDVLTMLQINEAVANAQGRKRTFLPLPDPVARAIAFLPGTPISSDQYALLKAGNVASGDHPGLADLGVRPRPISLFLDKWMMRFRKHGRFGNDAVAN